MNNFLNVITTRKTHQFDLGFISRNNSQKRNQKTKKTKKKQENKKNKQTNKQTPSLHILTIAGVFARNDQTLNTQIFPIAPLLATSLRINYQLLRAIKLKHVEPLFKSGVLKR